MTRIDVEALRLAHIAALVTERGTYDAYRRSRLAAAHALMALGRTWDGTPERTAAHAELHVAGLAEHMAYRQLPPGRARAPRGVRGVDGRHSRAIRAEPHAAHPDLAARHGPAPDGIERRRR